MNPLNLKITEKNSNLRKDVFLGSPGELSQEERNILQLFDGATQENWEDWRWQLQNRIRCKEIISRIIELTQEEEEGIDGVGSKLHMSITPYFASLMEKDNIHCPIRKQCIPTSHEMKVSDEEMVDPCGEDSHSPVHGLVHRYPDRVLFLVSEMCAMYCRFCTRSRMVGDSHRTLNTNTYEKAIEYIKSNKQIRDVLISGGDPLMLSNELLEHLVKSIKEIPHVEFLRIGTRVPVTLPQRIDQPLIDVLKKYGPVWMSIHFNHFKEITPRVKVVCDSLADNGIPLGSQTVLLKGINDDPKIIKRLMHELLKVRVKPYYLYQCDPIVGSSHFRTPLSVGIKIMENLCGHTTGYAIPTFVIDTPGGGGKIPVSPNYIVSQENNKYFLRNYEGKQYIHHDPI